MNFNRDEELAMFRILESMAKADDLLQNEEMNFLVRVANDFNWNNEDIQQSKTMTLKDAALTVMNMDHDKKAIFKDMLIKIADSDGDIHSTELNAVLDTFFVLNNNVRH